MTVTEPSEWIRTGQAASLVGYNRDAFRRKFFEAFQRQHGVIRLEGGQCKWKLVLVMRLRGDEDPGPMPNAG